MQQPRIPRKTRLVPVTIVVPRACLLVFAFTAVATLAGAGCVEVDGGAIEASWVLRTFDGRAISGCGCSNPEIARIRFVVQQVSPQGEAPQALGADVCAGQSGCEFWCHSQRGATPFFVPTGRYAISVRPLGPDFQPLPPGSPESAGVRVPAPILRDVEFGRPTQLDAVAIESGCAQTCNGDQSNQVCSND
jgi:hypothetical protein